MSLQKYKIFKNQKGKISKASTDPIIKMRIIVQDTEEVILNVISDSDTNTISVNGDVVFTSNIITKSFRDFFIRLDEEVDLHLDQLAIDARDEAEEIVARANQ